MIWTIVIALALGCSIVAITSSETETGRYIGVGGAVVFGFTLLLLLVVIACSNAFHDRSLAALQAEREALVYQVENNMYLGDAVGKFNSELVYNQRGHENPWTSWFYGSYWMEVDPIEFEK